MTLRCFLAVQTLASVSTSLGTTSQVALHLPGTQQMLRTIPMVLPEPQICQASAMHEAWGLHPVLTLCLACVTSLVTLSLPMLESTCDEVTVFLAEAHGGSGDLAGPVSLLFNDPESRWLEKTITRFRSRTFSCRWVWNF